MTLQVYLRCISAAPPTSSHSPKNKMWTEVKSELFAGVSAIGTETNWQPMASGAPPLHLMTAGIGSTNLATLTARRLNGWMDVKIAPPSGWTPDLRYWIFPTGRNPGCGATQWQPSHLPSFAPATYVHLVFGDQEPQLAVRTSAFLGESLWRRRAASQGDGRGWRQVGYRNKRIAADQRRYDVILKDSQQSCSCDDWTGTELLLTTLNIPLLPTDSPLIIILVQYCTCE